MEFFVNFKNYINENSLIIKFILAGCILIYYNLLSKLDPNDFFPIDKINEVNNKKRKRI